MSVRQDQVQIRVDFITDESKAFAKTILATKEFQKEMAASQRAITEYEKELKKKNTTEERRAQLLQLVAVEEQKVAANLSKIAAEGQKVQGLDLSKLAPAQLTERARQLEQAMRLIPQSAPEYQALATELKAVNDRMATLRNETRGVAAVLDDGVQRAGFFGRALSTAAGVFGALSFDSILDNLLQYGRRLFDIGIAQDSLANKTRTVFGEAESIVRGFAERNAQSIGLARKEYVNLATGIGDLLIPMGFTQRTAAELSTTLLNQAGVLSEWSGGKVSAQEASEILSKALLGERDALNSLGIDVKQSLVDAELKTRGLNKLTGESLRQAEALVTLDLITRQSASANEAFTKNADSLVRKKAELRARIAEVSQGLANGLVPAFGFLLDVAGRVLTVLIAFGQAIIAIPRFVSENRVAILSLVAAIVSLNAASIAAAANTLRVAAVQRGAAIATSAWAAAQRVLNLVMSANPIGAVVSIISLLIGGLTLAYQKSETFRAAIAGIGEVATSVFDGIKDVFGGFVSSLGKLLSGDIRGFLTDIGGAFAKYNPVSLAVNSAAKLAGAFKKGYEDSKTKDLAKKQAEDFKKESDNSAGTYTEAGAGAGQAYGAGLEAAFADLKKNSRIDPKEQAKATKDALDAALKAVELDVERRGIVLDKFRLDDTINEERYQEGVLDLKRRLLAEQLEVYRRFGQSQTLEAIKLQRELLEIEKQQQAPAPTRVTAPLAGRPLAPVQRGAAATGVDQIERETQAQELALKVRFRNQVINELQFNEQLAQLRVQEAARRLTFLQENGLRETNEYKKWLDERGKADEDYEARKLETKKRTIELERELEQARFGIARDALGVGIEFLQQEQSERLAKYDERLKALKEAGKGESEEYKRVEDERLKVLNRSGSAIKAFQKGEVQINLATEISGIWKNANVNPINALIPGWGSIFAGIQTALAIARASVQTAKIDAAKFAFGGLAKLGFFGGRPHSAGGTKGYFEDGTVIEVERDEAFAVVNKQDAPALRALSAINSRHGVPFYQSGGLRFDVGGLPNVNTTPATAGISVLQQQSGADSSAFVSAVKQFAGVVQAFPRSVQATLSYLNLENTAAELGLIRDDAAL